MDSDVFLIFFQTFSDITSLYIFKPPTQKEIMPHQGNINSATCSRSQLPFLEALFPRFQGHGSFTEYSEEQNKNCSLGICQHGSRGSPKSTEEQNLDLPSISYEGDPCPFQNNVRVERQLDLPFLKKVETETRKNASHLTLNNIGGPSHINKETTMPYFHCNRDASLSPENCPRSRITVSKVGPGKQLEISEFLKRPIYHDAKNEHLGKIQPLAQQLNSFHDFKHPPHFISSRNDVRFQQGSGNFLEGGRKASRNPEERFWGNPPFIQAMDSSPCGSHVGKAISSPDGFMNLDIQFTGEYRRGKDPNSLSDERRQQDISGKSTKQKAVVF